MLTYDRNKVPRELLYDAYFVAHVNVEYYERLYRRLDASDFWLRVIGAVLAAVSGVSAFKLPQDMAVWVVASAAILSTVAATLSLILRLPERKESASVLLARYTDHRGRFERLAQPMDDDAAMPREADDEFNRFRETEQLETHRAESRNIKIYGQAEKAARVALANPAN